MTAISPRTEMFRVSAGMVHALRIKDGQAVYHNHYLRTSSFWQTRRTVDRFTMLVGMIREVSQARLAQHVLDLLALRSQSLFIMFLSSSVSTQRAMKPKYLHKPIHLRDLKP